MSSTATRQFFGVSCAGPGEMGGGASPMFDGITNGVGDFISDLSAIKSKGARVVLKFVGAPNNYQNADSSFSMALWKAKMDQAAAKTNAQQMGNFVLDGTLLAANLIDDAKAGSTIFGGVPPTADEMDEMASYSKSKWSLVPTLVRIDNIYLAGVKSNWTYLDFGWCQWHERFGNAQTWFTNNVNNGRSVGLGCLLGMNGLHGGSGLTAPWNFDPTTGATGGTKVCMSPMEIDACTEGFSTATFAIGINWWSHQATFDPGFTFYNRTEIQAALQRCANVAIGRLAGPINWRDKSPSGSTDTGSGSSTTVGGSWSVVNNGSGSLKRSFNPASFTLTKPSAYFNGNLHCVLVYSRDSGLTINTPSGWSETKRISGSSGQGGELALFHKIASTDVNIGPPEVDLTLTTSGGNGDGMTSRWFVFSGNTDKISGLVAATGSTKSWTSQTGMGPIPGLVSTKSDALVLICAARANDFGGGSVEEDVMSATTSGGETWNRLFAMGSSQGNDNGMFVDWAATSGLASITSKSWSQTSGSQAGAGCGFMVAFAPTLIVAGTPAAFATDVDDATLSVNSTLSFTLTSTGSTPFTYSKVSGPSNITIGASTGAFQFTPSSVGTYVVVLRTSNSFGSDTATFNVFALSASPGNNSPPTITHPGNKTVEAHALLSFVIVATDPNGDPINYSLDAGAPRGTFIDNNTGQFVWIPRGDQGPGVYPIVAVVSDGRAESRSTFTVTVTDTPWTRDGGPSSQFGKTGVGNQFRRI